MRSLASLAALVVLAVLSMAPLARAQELPDLTLEELMRIDAGRVFGASERNQPATEAPASVSFITAEDIARHGYRTLADILRGVRGMYVSDDRNYSYLGTRGFSKPGDYNSRILLLLNGHRVNDNVYGQAEIGAEFGMDPAMFERVEIIRGPASSLYGDSAFFAVVNVITRTGASLDGALLAVEGGTLDTGRVHASVGRQLANGLDYALSGTFERSGGVKRLYFPAFDSPTTNNGVAEGLDGEQLGQFYGQASFRNLTVTGAYGGRRRDVPTASFGTIFNEQASREETTDRHALLDAKYTRTVGATVVVARASYDRFSAFGFYPNPVPGAAPLVGRSEVVGSGWTAAAWATRLLPGRQVFTAGAEFIDNVRQDQRGRYSDPDVPGFVEDGSSTQRALYAQDELKVARWLMLSVGLRYDGYDHSFQRVTPRAAVIVMPSHTQSFKYLFGQAFRAPNAYELNSFYFGSPSLQPESIDTHEVVWERYMNDWLRTSVSTYWYNAAGLITQTADPSTLLGVTYVNEGRVRASGLELEAEMRLSKGVQGLMSYALQRATDQGTHEVLPNSPRHMLKGRMSVHGPTDRSSIGVEAQYLSGRTTRAGHHVSSATLANIAMNQPIGRSLELVGSIRNLFNEQYADPASDAHFQDSIPQNGRTFRIGLTFKIPSK